MIIYTDARHFDYRSTKQCLRQLATSTDGRFGHAWIHLQGIRNGKPFVIEGGQSGELGTLQPRYFDGIATLIENGDPNPIQYLFQERQDGFFQKGAGGHLPTYAACRELTREQFEQMVAFIENYSFRQYSLDGQQCTSFVIEVAALAGWRLEGRVRLPINSRIRFQGQWLQLWSDPQYKEIGLYSPDKLEESLKRSVAAGEARKIN